MMPFDKLRGPGRVVTRSKVPQEREIWRDEIQPTPFVGRTRNKANRVIITDTSITVNGADGTVIIDGSSNMFKIIATGTKSVTGCDGVASPGCSAGGNTVTINTGLNYEPAHLSFRADGTFARNITRITAANTGGNGTVVDMQQAYTEVTGGTQTRWAMDWVTFVDRSAVTLSFKYYILQEAAL